jgi:hypothetical protein
MNLLVVGDCLLDVDLVGSVSRVCPDAPALVVDENVRRLRPGGAGLAAWLAARTDEPVTLVTALGDDDEGGHLRELLDGVRIVASPSGAPTPVKTRVRAAGHTLARIDRTGAGEPVVTRGDDRRRAVRRRDPRVGLRPRAHRAYRAAGRAHRDGAPDPGRVGPASAWCATGAGHHRGDPQPGRGVFPVRCGRGRGGGRAVA